MSEKFYTTRFENMKNRIQFLIKKHPWSMGGDEVAVTMAVCEEFDRMAKELDDLEDRIRTLEDKERAQ